ncbi:MAG: HlyD family secretion protein [Odoribacter sp.]|nr:HlyD family secretion protein [Odoribacter sp.]
MKKEQSARRNEEICDIIDRMPVRFGQWVAIAVVIFSLLILVFGWLIKYPDIVSGQITVNSVVAPVKLVAGSSGRIKLHHIAPQEAVTENTYLATIQNSANTEDIRKIDRLLSQINPLYNNSQLWIDTLPENVSLGELNLKYFAFLTAAKNIRNHEQNNTYEQQIKNLKDYIRWQNILIRQITSDTLTVREKLDILDKWLKRKNSLYLKDMITEKEYDDLKTEFLNTCSENQQLQKSITTIHIQIAEAEGKLNLLKTEKAEKEQQMHLELVASYNDLLDNIKNWEQKYVLKAPMNGRVEFLKFLTDNQFIQTGEEIFSIVPEKNTILGQMLLPATGAGKVEIASPVIIKLDNYPYLEYGSIDGRVSSISLVTTEEQIANMHVATYLITIELPQGLTTNYGKKLDFRHEIKGTAEIIVNDRRLIERLFDNLKYRIQ